ncbi:hypothetical protein [Candidatus Thiosymbion oneisti]|uniref:hypothetical protein n=1 Tax=Candidatus Thiosymbion oneisti TaxID=589554 RepID=UPI0015B4A1D6|nr:hypothetical protein [Candidatus Thiosymbion oneisti]
MARKIPSCYALRRLAVNSNESTIVAKIKDLFCKKNLNPGCAKALGRDEAKALTCQFHTTLRAYITKIEETAPNPVPKALERIREITKKEDKDLSWQDAYEIEQQLVQLYDEPTLYVEIERRLLEAEQSLSAATTSWYRKRAEALQEDPEGLAALLSGLINDLQWRYTKNQARRTYTREITGRTETVYMLTFGFVFVLLMSRGLLFEDWLLPFVALAGAFGAAFSMMTGLRKRLAGSTFGDLKLNRCWWLILTRVLVGIGASFILYFFLRSGLVSGEAFPNLSQETVDLSHKDFAKLFIGCFIAGFSEKLVPNLLSRTQQRFEMAAEPKQILKAPPAQTGSPTSRSRGRSKEDTGKQSDAGNG